MSDVMIELPNLADAAINLSAVDASEYPSRKLYPVLLAKIREANGQMTPAQFAEMLYNAFIDYTFEFSEAFESIADERFHQIIRALISVPDIQERVWNLYLLKRVGLP
jgi:hypothetical protein